MDSFVNWFKHGFLQLPFQGSAHGKQVDDFIMYVHWLMLALFVGWLGYFVYVLFRFRASRQPKADYLGARTHASSYLEGLVALIEGVLLLGLAVPLWATVVRQVPDEKASTVISVLGRQFNWMVHYAGPDGVAGRQDPKLASAVDPFGIDRQGDPHGLDDVVQQGTIVVPVDKPVLIHLTSLDVIHSLAIQNMRVCQDAIPGLSIPVWFTPVETGDFRITCAQLCGNSHYGMAGILRVVPQAEFDRWLLEQSNKARAGAGQPVSYE